MSHPSKTSPILMCDDVIDPVPRQSDGQGFFIICQGGVRASKIDSDRWMLEPVLDAGRSCRKGFFDKAGLNNLLKHTQLSAIAFQKISWLNGAYHSNWSPLIPGRKNHMRGPSDLWGSLASNSARERIALLGRDDLTQKILEEAIDDREPEEWLARSIGLSLRSMDICVEQIADFYNEQLTNLTAAGQTEGRLFASTRDQALFAFVHSFFLHLGAARDYLATLIAVRLRKSTSKIDSMSRLIDSLRATDAQSDALLDLLIARGFVRPAASSSSKKEIGGWLAEASDLRNRFVHRRPYGAHHVERFGRVTAIAANLGIYRYVRPVALKKDSEHDILDVVLYHYRQATMLFQDLAEASGKDTSMMTITDADISSVEIH